MECERLRAGCLCICWLPCLLLWVSSGSWYVDVFLPFGNGSMFSTRCRLVPGELTIETYLQPSSYERHKLGRKLPDVENKGSGSSGGDITTNCYVVVVESNVTNDESSQGCSDRSSTFISSLGCHAPVVCTRMR